MGYNKVVMKFKNGVNRLFLGVNILDKVLNDDLQIFIEKFISGTFVNTKIIVYMRN